MNRAVTVFKNDDLKLAKSVEPLEEVIGGLNMEIKRRLSADYGRENVP